MIAPLIRQREQKQRFRQFVWQWLLSIAEVLQISLAHWSAKPMTVVKTSGGYCFARGVLANTSTGTRRANDLDTIRSQLLSARKSTLPIVVRITDDDALFKTRTFPKAVADVIEPVLRNQIQKLVPWAEDDIAFGYSLPNQKDSDDQVEVKLAITRQTLIEQIRHEAQAARLHLHAIEGSREGASESPVEIYSAVLEKRERLAKRIGRFFICLAALSIAITTYGLFNATHYQWNKYEIERSIAIQKASLDRAVAALRSRTQSAARVDAMIARKRNQLPRVAIVDELSKELPDKTWLDGLDVRGDVVVISGFSNNAAAIVRMLDESDDFTDVRFVGATERSKFSDREKFKISMRLANLSDGNSR